MTLADIIIIGAGPGGYELAAEAAAEGNKVVLIEKDKLGGTCLNRGCIPTKALCRSAEIALNIKESEIFGIAASCVRTEYGKASERKDTVVSQLREGVALAVGKCEVVEGEAIFKDAQTVLVGEEVFTAPKIVVATGSVPASIPIPGAEYAIDSDKFLNLTEIPENVTIIGGGVIGMEFASILNAFGVEVSVIEFCKEILPPFDKDVAKRLRTTLQKRGINILVGAAAQSIEKTDSGLKVNYEAKGKPASIDTDMVIMAVGRRPSIPDGLEETGVRISKKGIEVDCGMQTSVPGIYAIGDVNGNCMLAHAASAQGRIILGKKINLDVIPAAVFTTPECSMVGKTEEQLKAEGVNIRTSKALFRGNGKALAMGETDGMVKLIIDSDSRLILGCHIMGPHAADLIQEIAVAMANGLTVDAISDTIHGHPTLGEVVQQAARML